MDIFALLLFFGVIVLAFVRKTNIGIFAMAAGVLAVYICDLTEKNLISGISTSMFVTLVGITFLFSIVQETGALDLLSRKVASLAGQRVWLIPIAIYAAGFIIAGIGPGAVPGLAIVQPLAIAIALEVGYNPIMMGVIGTAGLFAGRMTPITPEAAVINEVAVSSGFGNVMPSILVCQTLVTICFVLIVFVVFKGYKVKKPLNATAQEKLPKFSVKQIISLCSILLMLGLIIFAGMNVGLAAIVSSAILLLLRIADDSACIKSMPWSTILMVLCVGALMNVVDAIGGIDLLSNALSSIMTEKTATPIMCISSALMSLVSSALAVVYPTMMPMTVDIAANIGGNVSPVALMAAVGAGGSMAAFSPLSTGGALLLAALGTSKHGLTKEGERKAFVKLFGITALSVVVAGVVSITFNWIVSLIY